MPVPLSSDAQALKELLDASTTPITKATLGRVSHIAGGRLTAALQELAAAGLAYKTREGDVELWGRAPSAGDPPGASL